MNKRKRIGIIYHDHCSDGFGSAVAANCFLKDEADLSFYPCMYGKPFPQVKDNLDQIYVLDFSFPKDVLLAERKKRPIFVIDHHETAKNNLEGLEDCIFDMGHSGAYLSWVYFAKQKGIEINSDNDIPAIIRFIQDRDLWKFEMEDTEAFHAGLNMIPKTLESWSRLLSPSFYDGKYESPNPEIVGGFYKEIFMMGETILKYQKSEIAKNIANPFDIEFVESVNRIYKGKAINNYFMPSETAHAMLDKFPDIDFACCYFEVSPGIYKYSIRGRKDGVKVNTLAGWLGGGGHPSAAGFTYNKWGSYPTCLVTMDEKKKTFTYRKDHTVSLNRKI